MVLYYTGVTRLAKNILQEIVDRVNQREPAYLFTHRRLGWLVAQAREAISSRDYEALSEVVQASWSANKLLHENTTNHEIEQLLGATARYWKSAKLLGAGGGYA